MFAQKVGRANWYTSPHRVPSKREKSGLQSISDIKEQRC